MGNQVSVVSTENNPNLEVNKENSSASAVSTENHDDFQANKEMDSSARRRKEIAMRSQSLSSNMMRSQHSRDPMKFYEVVELLGEGSMGSVAKVLDTAVGGSARNDFVKQHKNKWCFSILPSFCPVFSGSVAFKEGKFMDLSAGASTRTATTVSSTNTGSQRSIESNSRHNKNRSSDTAKERSTAFARRSSSLITYGPKKEVHYALKTLHLDRCKNVQLQEELKNEVEILRRLDHPNIVRAIEQFNYMDRLYLVLELCSGGDLYVRDPYVEDHAQEIMTSLLSAVAYLHSKNIIHRDLKFENVMFVNSSPQAEVKIIDFGLSKKYAANLHDAVGTVYTMAPELLAQDYDNKADVWSLGVIAFMLLSSSMPFYGKDRTQVIKRIIRGRYRFSARRWHYVSIEAQNFVSQLLQIDPNKRPSANQALKSRWITGTVGSNGEDGQPTPETIDRVISTMETFANYGKLKKLALMVIAYKSTSEEVGFLKSIFHKFDVSQDGEISVEEFKDAFSDKYDYSDDELERIFSGVDIDGTGSVHYCEFLAATIEAHGSIDEERLAEAFDRIDEDDSGFITVENLKEFLGSDIPTHYLEDIIEEVDQNHDNRIEYEEFVALWDEEGDKVLEDTKLQVQARRLRCETSALSSQSSKETELATDSERSGVQNGGSSSAADIDAKNGGSYYYTEMKKEYSVRGDWV